MCGCGVQDERQRARARAVPVVPAARSRRAAGRVTTRVLTILIVFGVGWLTCPTVTCQCNVLADYCTIINGDVH